MAVDEPTLEFDLDLDTLSGDSRTAMLDLFRDTRSTWGMMSQDERARFSANVDSRMRYLVRKIAAAIAAEGRPAITVTVDSVSRKPGKKIEAKILVSQYDEQRHELFDAAGDVAVLCVSNAERYIGERVPEEVGDPELPLQG